MTTFDDVIRFLKAKSTNDTCPSCQHDDWIIEAGTGDDGVFRTLPGLVLGSVKDDSPNISIAFGARPVTLLVCKNCGYLRLYSYNVIKSWLEANPAGSEKEHG